MFTSRSEYRRQPAGRQCRRAPDREGACDRLRRPAARGCIRRLRPGMQRPRAARAVRPDAQRGGRARLGPKPGRHPAHGLQLLSHPGIRWPAAASGRSCAASPARRDRLETDATYAVYLDRQAADIAAYRRDERIELDKALDFRKFPGLSNEIGPSSTWSAHGRRSGRTHRGHDTRRDHPPGGACPQAREQRRGG